MVKIFFIAIFSPQAELAARHPNAASPSPRHQPAFQLFWSVIFSGAAQHVKFVCRCFVVRCIEGRGFSCNINPAKRDGLQPLNRGARTIRGCSPCSSVGRQRTLNPLTRAHHRLRITRRADTVHVDAVRSDHPVHVNQAGVCATRCQLLWREAVAVLQA